VHACYAARRIRTGRWWKLPLFMVIAAWGVSIVRIPTLGFVNRIDIESAMLGFLFTSLPFMLLWTGAVALCDPASTRKRWRKLHCIPAAPTSEPAS